MSDSKLYGVWLTTEENEVLDEALSDAIQSTSPAFEQGIELLCRVRNAADQPLSQYPERRIEDTILVALRLLQEHMSVGGDRHLSLAEEILDEPENTLDHDEINDLCEQVNTQDMVFVESGHG